MTTPEVTVRGAGIFGLSCAWSLVRRGAKVRVIDPGGVGAGASGGIVGALSPHVPENWNAKKAFQFESLMLAESYWADVDRSSGLPSGYGRVGRLQPIDDTAVALARKRAETATELWQGKARWDVMPAVQHPLWTPNSSLQWMIRDTLSARIHPRQALVSLAAAIQKAGGEILKNGTDRGPVIWATGVSGLTEMSPPGVGVKGQAALLDIDARGTPQIFMDGLYVIPHADGTTAIGSTSERTWETENTDAKLDELLSQARDLMPCLSDAAVVERWAGIRPRSASRAPILGHHPSRAGAYIANGGFKIGFGMAPLIGEVMADLILDGHDRIPKDFRAA